MLAALDRVEDEMADGTFAFVPSDEDMHTAVERRVTELAGAAGAEAAHRPQPQRPGGHRLPPASPSVAAASSPARCSTLAGGAAGRAEEAGGAYLPGYTHLQRAQPVLLAHHLLAHGWALARDVDRLLDTAGASTCRRSAPAPWPGRRCRSIRRTVAEDLGFAAAFENSLDATSDRDFVAEALFDLALLGVHLSRIGEEVWLWASDEFGFLRLADSVVDRLVDDAAEEEPRHRRAGAGQGRPADRQPHRRCWPR